MSLVLPSLAATAAALLLVGPAPPSGGAAPVPLLVFAGGELVLLISTHLLYLYLILQSYINSLPSMELFYHLIYYY